MEADTIEDILGSSDEYESSSDVENEAGAAVGTDNKGVYDTAALHEKLEDMAWEDGTGFLESLSVGPSEVAGDTGGVDANDDLAREMSFYMQALEAAKRGYSSLHEVSVSFLRPADYYAEMVKSDSHMLKIKDRLLAEQRQISEAEERRKQRDLKRYSKEVQAEKLKERTKQKKQDIESVKKWRKVRQNSDFKEGAEDFPVALDEPSGAGRKNNTKKADRSIPKGGQGSQRSPSKKRQVRDSKFGFGGRKKLAKQNSAESSADMSGFKAGKKGFSPGGKKSFSPGGKPARKGKEGANRRPGKSKRQTGRK